MGKLICEGVKLISKSPLGGTVLLSMWWLADLVGEEETDQTPSVNINQ